MSPVTLNKKGLIFNNFDDNYGLILDSHNVFWAISAKRQDGNIIFPTDIISFYNKIRSDLDSQMHDFRFSANLTAIYIDPTDRCNANCPYCYVPTEIRKNGQSLTKGQLTFILEKIAKYFQDRKRKPVIVFHASEPLLVKDTIFEGIKKFNKQFKFGLQTNAILLEEHDVKFLKKYRVGIGISLDSPDPKVNNLLRPSAQSGESFERVIKALDWFNGYEGLNVITTITKFNVTHLPRMVKFLHTRKVPCVLLNPVRFTQRASRALKPDEGLLTKYFIQALNTAMELSKKSKQRIIIGNFTNIILGIVAPMARRLMCDISPCGGGRCFLTVTASGDIIPCGEFIGLREFSAGNIFKTSIEEAMQSRAFQKIRARIVERITQCSSCAFRNICGAPCPAELYALGDMYQASIFCDFYKEIIKYAFKIIAEKKEKYCFREESLNNLHFQYQLGDMK